MSDEPEENPLPSLGYATLDADGLPEFMPEVEAAIDQGMPPRNMCRYFRRRDEVGRYIAKSLRRRFEPRAVNGDCVACGMKTQCVVTVRWSFKQPVSFLTRRGGHVVRDDVPFVVPDMSDTLGRTSNHRASVQANRRLLPRVEYIVGRGALGLASSYG